MKKSSFTKRNIFITVLVLIVALIASTFATFYVQTRAPASASSQRSFEVQSGETINSVTNRLESEGFVKSAFFSAMVAKFSNLTDLKAGMYTLDPSWDTYKVLDVLTTATSDQVTVQLLEGGWAKDFAAKLSEALNIPAQDFLDAWNDEVYIRELMEDYPVLTEDILKNAKDVRVLLEGYLYPDTYNFERISTVDDVTRRILDNTEAKYELYTDDLANTELSLHDVIRLSSIVMYESHHYEDMQMIAGVFMNRLGINQRLEASTTVCYALYEYSNWRDCEVLDNLKIDSLYNTYMYNGLPVGPILNPSVDAIKATIDYTHHNYFFFFSDVESGGEGKVYYSETYAEHEAKRDEVNQNLNGGN